MYASTISSVALTIAKALDAAGCDSHNLFKQVGLDPEKMRDPNARYSYSAMQRLWHVSVEATKDPCFGLKVFQHWHPTTLHALGYSWMASATLEEAFERMIRYFRIVSTSGSQAIIAENAETSRFYYLFPPNYPPPSYETIDAAFAMIVHMCRTSYGPEFKPVRVELQREKPPCADQFDEFFQCEIVYDAPESGLILANETLNKPLSTANTDLARANDAIITEYLAHLDRSDIAMQVKAKLIEHLPSGHVSEITIADTLHVSQRTLQRKLRDQNTSYKQLLDDTRKELASQYIGNSQLSISEITFLLGFSEASNFSRAFKRWKGVPPSEYRLSN